MNRAVSGKLRRAQLCQRFSLARAAMHLFQVISGPYCILQRREWENVRSRIVIHVSYSAFSVYDHNRLVSQSTLGCSVLCPGLLTTAPEPVKSHGGPFDQGQPLAQRLMARSLHQETRYPFSKGSWFCEQPNGSQ